MILSTQSQTDSRSPLVHAVSKGRQDLVHLMVKHFGFDVDAVEDNTGLNPLAMAVSKQDLHLTEYLVQWYLSLSMLKY